MDEYNSGMEPHVKRYFRKIISSFTWLLLWLMGIVTAGLFFKLGEINDEIKWYNILFYLFAVVTFVFLIRHLFKLWLKKSDK